jgi:hypothetical protein
MSNSDLIFKNKKKSIVLSYADEKLQWESFFLNIGIFGAFSILSLLFI